MALFNNTKKVTKKASAPKAAPKLPQDGRLENVIKAPWLSEKALIGTENGVYVFAVPADATKTSVAAAIQSIYNVTPRQVRMVNLPAKKVSLRTRRGTGSRARRHKAYVYLKAGDTIQFA
ncbi:MAG: 50S ribosomal protein L23 [Bacillota bacterium]